MMAPMASGKGQLVSYIRENFPQVKFLVSCTTRDPRPGEVHGVDYYFISPSEFEDRIANGEFIEWAEFSGNKYGTLKSEILEPLLNGEVVLNEIELQGVKILEDIIPKEKRTLVYIENGGWEVSLQRMRERAPMSDEHVALRHERYLEEVKAKSYADIIIENYDGQLDVAKERVHQLVQELIDRVAQ